MSYDFSFDKKRLSRELRHIDYKEYKLNDELKEEILIRAERDALEKLPRLHLNEYKGRSKPLYQVATLGHDLILRKLNRNIKRTTRVRQADREAVVMSLKNLFEEGHAFRVYRLDISSFYESVDRDSIMRRFEADRTFSRASTRILKGVFDELDRRHVSGLPRGLAISSTLSELYMRKFDNEIRKRDFVYYYARYVDDIVIVTTAAESEKSFMKEIRSTLPRGTTLNQSKSSKTYFSPKESDKEKFIDFLGYDFIIAPVIRSGNSVKRSVRLDISKKKVSRFKMRICRSLQRFGKDRDFESLDNRFKILCGNYNMRDKGKSIDRNVGIHFNYRFIDSSKSTALPEMSSFIRYVLYSRSSPVVTAVSELTDSQKRNLLAKCPQKNHRDKIFYHISHSSLRSAAEAWMNG